MFYRTAAILVCAGDELNQGSGTRKEGKALPFQSTFDCYICIRIIMNEIERNNGIDEM